MTAEPDDTAIAGFNTLNDVIAWAAIDGDADLEALNVERKCLQLELFVKIHLQTHRKDEVIADATRDASRYALA